MTAPFTPDERAEWRALADAATPGPWEAHEGTVGAMTGPRGCGGCSGLVSPRHEPACFWSEVAGAAPADAAFIAAARAAVPRLLDALDTAEAEVARLREAAAPVRPDRETIARALRDAGLVEVVAVHEGYGAEEVVHSHLRPVANAVLDLWPGESRATVQAEALRDAAAAAIAQDNNQGDWWDDDQQTYGTPVDWLRARADRLDPKEK